MAVLFFGNFTEFSENRQPPFLKIFFPKLTYDFFFQIICFGLIFSKLKKVLKSVLFEIIVKKFLLQKNKKKSLRGSVFLEKLKILGRPINNKKSHFFNCGILYFLYIIFHRISKKFLKNSKKFVNNFLNLPIPV